MSELRTMNLDSLSHAQQVKFITSFGGILPLWLSFYRTDAVSLGAAIIIWDRSSVRWSWWWLTIQVSVMSPYKLMQHNE